MADPTSTSGDALTEVERLCALLESGNIFEKHSAAQTLGNIGTMETILTLQSRAWRDRNQIVRVACQVAIERIRRRFSHDVDTFAGAGERRQPESLDISRQAPSAANSAPISASSDDFVQDSFEPSAEDIAFLERWSGGDAEAEPAESLTQAHQRVSGLRSQRASSLRDVGAHSRPSNRDRTQPIASTIDAKKPPYSRQQLNWSIFEQCGDSEWRLVLPSYYAWLFSNRHSEMLSVSHTGWRNTQNGRHQFAFFRDLSEEDIQDIQRFVTAYRRPVIIGLNDHIRPHFTDELNACMCLDFNMAQTEAGEFVRTEMGELEYRAKYQQSAPAIESLVNHLENAIRWMPIANMLDPNIPVTLTYIPPEPTKAFHLPRELGRQLAQRLAPNDQGQRWLPLVDATLTGHKAALKSATLEQKIAEWQRITEHEEIQLATSVEGCAVYILDDLYQSGVTMWTYARYLKSLGARWVFGLACVKSLRDTDNI